MTLNECFKLVDKALCETATKKDMTTARKACNELFVDMSTHGVTAQAAIAENSGYHIGMIRNNKRMTHFIEHSKPKLFEGTLLFK